MDSHYIPCYTEVRFWKYQRTACGIWITFDRHDVEPTCVRCAEWLHCDAVGAAKLVRRWGEEEGNRGNERSDQ